jgi:regulator of nucleoside diphosphate kinase
MENKEIFMVEDDINAIKKLTADNGSVYGSNRKYFEQLIKEVSRAKVIKKEQAPDGLVRLGSMVEIIDEQSAEKTVFKLVLPQEASPDDDKVSILAPIGTAVIGYRQNDVIEWKVPLGIRRIKLNKVENP